MTIYINVTRKIGDENNNIMGRYRIIANTTKINGFIKLSFKELNSVFLVEFSNLASVENKNGSTTRKMILTKKINSANKIYGIPDK